MLTRRTALLSTLAAGACATSSGAPLDEQFTNIETQSDSVHSGVSSEDGERRVTVRLCQYPQLGLAWVWIHARTPEGFFSYVDHMAPAHVNPSVLSGRMYRDDERVLEFVRRGEKEKPTAATITGSCLARKSATSAFGKGEHRMDVSIEFSPERLYSGLNAGRTEVFGRSKAVVTIDGRRTEIEGPAQFHEQGQTNPRFTAPFCYMTLWGDGAASTMLIAPKRRDGYLLEGDASTEVTGVRVDPPGRRAHWSRTGSDGKTMEYSGVDFEEPWGSRAMHVMLADGRTLEGEARVIQAYTIPLVGQTWRGHMVNVELGGRSYRGHINDYIIGDGVAYAG